MPLRGHLYGSVVESVDTPDLKSVELMLVGVQVSPLLLGDLRTSSPAHER